MMVSRVCIPLLVWHSGWFVCSMLSGVLDDLSVTWSRSAVLYSTSSIHGSIAFDPCQVTADSKSANSLRSLPQLFDSSDGWVIKRLVCLCKLRFDSKSGQTNDFEIANLTLLAWRSALKGQCGGQAGKFTGCAAGKGKLTGFLRRDVVDRWLATSKRARQSALIAFSWWQICD